MSAAVVKLPTAARRQVQQPQNKEARAAKRALREQQSQAFPYRNHTVRQADEIAGAISPMTPERWLLLGILHTMDAGAFAKLTAFGASGNPAIRGLMQLAKANFGLQMDVMRALEERGR